MIVIRNTKLFQELKEVAREGGDLWKALWREGKGCPELKDPRIPFLAGGLDHIDIKPRGIYFHDIGVSVGGTIRDNSFVIRPEKEV